MPVLIYFTIVSILCSIHIWRNILCYKEFICKWSTNLPYIRILYLQRHFLIGYTYYDLFVFYARIFCISFYMYTFMVRNSSFLEVPNLLVLCFRLSLMANNPRRFQRVIKWIWTYIDIFYYILICHFQLCSLPFYIEL